MKESRSGVIEGRLMLVVGSALAMILLAIMVLIAGVEMAGPIRWGAFGAIAGLALAVFALWHRGRRRLAWTVLLGGSGLAVSAGLVIAARLMASLDLSLENF